MADDDRNAIELSVLRERLDNFIEESTAQHIRIQNEIQDMRKQTHDWMQAMLNRLPPWAMAIGSLLTTLVGAMATLLFTHK